LEEKVVAPEEIIDCENKRNTRINGIPVSTTVANDRIPFEDVIRFSNNIGVAKVGQRLGTKLYDHYLRLGFSKKIGIFPGESPGRVSHPSSWSKASLISLSFGYEISATIAQVAQALSIIANDGYLVPLHLIQQDVQTEGQPEGPLYSKEAITQMKNILRATIDHGSAQKARINGYAVMGKTGTARLLTNGRYDQKRHIFSFMAIVEKGDYKRIVVISLKETSKHGYLAARAVVPLFERVAHKMLIHDKII
jgi:cell division protein FtsI (penicillin-binding protein 3)